MNRAQGGQVQSVFVAPAPQTLRQDVQNHGFLVNICELIDNGVSAAAQAVAVAAENRVRRTASIYIETEKQAKRGDCLIIHDNGIGMSEEVLKKCMIASMSYSSKPELQRDDKPLKLAQYLDPHFNRFGRGLASVLYFGSKVEILSKQAGSTQAQSIMIDYDEWVQAYNNNQRDKEWRAQSRSHEEVDPGWGDSFTRITIWSWYPKAADELRQQHHQQHIANVAALYYFHLYKLPFFIHDKVPEVLKETRAGRKTFEITMFGTKLPQKETADQLLECTPVHATIKPATEAHRQCPQLKPLFLAYRYVPHGKTIQQPTAGAAAVSSPPSCLLDGVEDCEKYWKELSRKAESMDISTYDGSSAPPSTPGAKRVMNTAAGASVGRSGGKGKAGGTPNTPHPPTRGQTPAAYSQGGSQGQKRKRPQSTPNTNGSAGGGDGSVLIPRDDEDDSDEDAVPIARRKRLGYINTIEQTEPNYIDLLLILLYYPYKDGKPTKSDSSLGTVPLWSGRVMPNDDLLLKLPDIVSAAKSLAQQNQSTCQIAHHLDISQIGGLMFISPDCLAGRNKDSLFDAAIKEFTLLGNPSKQHLHSQARGGIWHVWNYAEGRFQPDADGHYSSRMVLKHHEAAWMISEDIGRIEVEGMDLVKNMTYGTVYNPPKRSGCDKLSAGDLVRILGDNEGTLSDMQDGPEMRSSTSAVSTKDKKAHEYYVVQRFTSLVNSAEVFVELKRWAPDWGWQGDTPDARKVVQLVTKVVPLRKNLSERKVAEDTLIAHWNKTCPYQLAYKADTKGSSNSNLVGTRKVQESASLARYQDAKVVQGTLEEIVMVVLDQTGKPIIDHARTSFQLHNKSCYVQAKLSRKDEATGTFNQAWSGRAWLSGSTITLKAEDISSAVQECGEYQLHLQLHHEFASQPAGYLPKATRLGEPPDLLYRFSVIPPAAEPEPQLHLAWQQEEAHLPDYVRVDARLPDLVLKLDKPRSFPVASPDQLLPALKLILQPVRPGRQAQDAPATQEGPSAGMVDSPAVPSTAGVAPTIGSVAGGKRSCYELQLGSLPQGIAKVHWAAKDHSAIRLEIVGLPRVLHHLTDKAFIDARISIGYDPSTLPQNNGAEELPLSSRQPAGKGSRAASKAISAQPRTKAIESSFVLMRIASGSAVRLQRAEGRGTAKSKWVDASKSPPNVMDIAKGAYPPVSHHLRLVDASGSPFYFPGDTMTSSKQQACWPPTAKLSFTNAKYLNENKACDAAELPFNASAELEIDRDKCYVTGPMGGHASIEVVIPADRFPEAGPPKDLALLYSITITKCHISFTYSGPGEADKETAKEAALLKAVQPGDHQKEVICAKWLDLLQRCQTLTHIQGASTKQLLKEDTNIMKSDQAQDVKAGLQILTPDAVALPNGHVFRGAAWEKDVVKFVNRVHKEKDLRIYDPLLILGHECTTVSGIGISICTYVDDLIDNTFCAPFKVVMECEGRSVDVYPPRVRLGSKLAAPDERQTKDGYSLPELQLHPKVIDQLKKSHTVKFNVTDDEHPDVVYGCFYVRQAPRPASLKLLPSSPAMLNQLDKLQFCVTHAISTAPGQAATSSNDVAGAILIQPSDDECATSTGNRKAGSDPFNSPSAIPRASQLVRKWHYQVAGQPDKQPFDLVHDQAQLQPGCVLQVVAGQPFMVHFMLMDQLSVPLKLSDPIKEQFRQKARAIAATNEGGSSSGRRKKAAEAAGTDADVELSDWQWNLPTGRLGVAAAGVSMRVAGLGAMTVKFCVEGLKAVPEALIAANVSFELPVNVISSSIAKTGIQLQYAGIREVEEPAARELLQTIATSQNGSPVVPQPATNGTSTSPCQLSVVELLQQMPQSGSVLYKEVQLSDGAEHVLPIQLVDENRYPVGEAAIRKADLTAVAIGTTTFHCSLTKHSGKQGMSLSIKVPELAHRLCQQRLPNGELAPQLLLIKPQQQDCPALPILLLITLTTGQYPVALQPLVFAPGWQECRNLHSPPEKLQVGMPLPHLLPPSASVTDWKAEFLLGSVGTRLPAFQVAITDAYGSLWGQHQQQLQGSARLQPLQLSWQRMVRLPGVQEVAWEPEQVPTDGRGIPCTPPVLTWPLGPAVIPVHDRPLPQAAGLYRLVLTQPGLGQQVILGPILVKQPHRLVTFVPHEQPANVKLLDIRNPEDLQLVLEASTTDAQQQTRSAAHIPTSTCNLIVQLQDHAGFAVPLPEKQSQVCLELLQLDESGQHATHSWLVHQQLAPGKDGSVIVPAITLASLRLLAQSTSGSPDAKPSFRAGERYSLAITAQLMGCQLAYDCAYQAALMQGRPGQEALAAAEDAKMHGWPLRLNLVQWLVTAAELHDLQKRLADVKRDRLAKQKQKQVVEAELHMIRERLSTKQNAVQAAQQALNALDSFVLEQHRGWPSVTDVISRIPGKLQDYSYAPAPMPQHGYAGGQAGAGQHRLHMPRAYRTRRDCDVFEKASRFAHSYRHDEVLGLGCMLLRCECEDVCGALMPYLGGARYMVMLRKVPDIVNEWRRIMPSGRILFLENPEREGLYTNDQCDEQHAQKPLQMLPTNGTDLQATVNRILSSGSWSFVGYAANLVYLPPALLNIRVMSQDRRKSWNLRQSLVFSIFKKLMVFEDTKGMEAFADQLRSALPKKRLEGWMRMISLDGGNINLEAGVEGAGEAYTDTFRLAGVSGQEQVQMRYPLDERMKTDMGKLHELQGLVAKRQELDQDLRHKQGEAQAEGEQAVAQEQEALQQQAALEQEMSSLQCEIDKLKSQIQTQTNKT